MLNKLRRFFTSQDLINEAILKEQKEQANRYNKISYMELNSFVNKPIISVGNEWADPVIGYGKRVELITKGQCPVLIVYDYLSNTEYMVLSKVMSYTEQRFEAIMKLDPFERASLLYPNYIGFDKDKIGKVSTREEIIETLTKNKFYEHMSK